MPSKEQILERERRWRLVAGLAAVAGVALVLASFGDSGSVRGGEGFAGRLAEIHEQHGKVISGGVIQLIGWSLLAVPLAFLFKAASARSSRVRAGLIGIVVAGPVLFGVAGLVGAGSTIQAADDFTAMPAGQIDRCVKRKAAERDSGATGRDGKTGATGATGEKADGSRPEQGGGKSEKRNGADPDKIRSDCEDEAAQDARRDAKLTPLATGLTLAGLIGITVAVLYTSLSAMRTGLLSRFWGALGVALGAVFVFFWLFTLAWFIYLGLLLVGWIPGGRPPAWAAGKAVPPPQPRGGGLFGPRPGQSRNGDPDGPVDKWGEPIEGSSEELEPLEAPEPPEVGEGEGSPDPDTPGPAPRKRKRRDR